MSFKDILAEKLNRTQKVEAKDYPVREMAETLLSMTDAQFGQYAFYHEPLAGKFTAEERRTYIEKANACGKETASAFRRDSTDGKGGRAVFSEEDIKALAESFGVKVREKKTPLGGGHVIFAQYVEPSEITVFTDCLDVFAETVEKEDLTDLFEEVDVKAVLLAHELFHVLEHSRKDSIYTQTETIELWKKPLSNRSRILALSEIAAMAFAKEMTGIQFSPYALDVLLIAGYNKEAACALYEEILEAAAEAGRTAS